ncbi:hypothetical protein [Kribbella sp. NPDC048928]|uniref:hypothetical protein n=1 Tax=Kribbella sp. NPDC048928 TaxID=3364111 RepID=UPI0037109C69
MDEAEPRVPDPTGLPEPPHAPEAPTSDPKDPKEPPASPEPPTTPKPNESAEEKDADTSSPRETSRSDQAVDEEAVADEAGTDRRTDDDVHKKGDRGTFPVDIEIGGETVRDRFDRWDPERLAMPRPAEPEVSNAHPGERTEASDRPSLDVRTGVAYIAANKDTRPWLAPAADCEPIVQSVYASIDQSEGHGHIRHGAMGSDDLQARRVAFNEDPAQTDPVKREAGVDGLDQTKQHYCGKDSTRVHDATALAAVYVMAAEHPKVRAVLDGPFDENVQPRDLVVPIRDLLGPDGHEFCSGFRLKDWPEAKSVRKEWLQAKRTGSDLSGLREPEVERIPTFEGGDIKIVFKRNVEAKRYGIYTLFPRPFEE